MSEEEREEKLEQLRQDFDIMWPPETSQERYHYMASKNKVLEQLKEEYDLIFK